MSVKIYPIMPKICNITDDFIKNVRAAWLVPVGQPECDLENILTKSSLSNIIKQIPEDQILKIELLPDDIRVNSSQKDSSAGAYFTHSFSITAQPNKITNLEIIDFFTNTRVLLYLFTTAETYLVGSNEQGLLFLFDEYTTHFIINISGDTYFTALRN